MAGSWAQVHMRHSLHGMVDHSHHQQWYVLFIGQNINMQTSSSISSLPRQYLTTYTTILHELSRLSV